MRRIAVLFGIVLFLAVAVHGQDQYPQPVQAKIALNSATLTTDHSVASGDCGVVLVADENNGTTISSVTDTVGSGTSYSLIDSWLGAGGVLTFAFKGVLAGSGTNTITLHGTFTTVNQAFYELPSSVGCTVDAHTTGAPGSGDFTTSAITTTQNGDFLMTVVSAFNSALEIAKPPMQPLTNEGGSGGIGVGYKITGTSGSYSASFQNTFGTFPGYVIFAFKPSAIVIDTTVLPSAALSNSYSYCLQARGGAGAYTWSISSGALPTGLSINSSTGCVTGTPTGGTAIPTFQVTDGTHTATQSLTLTVNSSPGTVSLVQSVAVNGTLSSVSIGDAIIVADATGSAISAPSGCSTSYRYLGTVFSSTAGNQARAMWMGKATSSGSCSISVSVGGIAAQFSGAQTFADVFGQNNGSCTPSCSITGPTLTTLAPNSEIWAVTLGTGSNAAYTAGSGFTNDGSNGGASTRMQGEDGSFSTAAAHSVTATQTANSSSTWMMGAIALRPLPSGVVSAGGTIPAVY